MTRLAFKLAANTAWSRQRLSALVNRGFLALLAGLFRVVVLQTRRCGSRKPLGGLLASESSSPIDILDLMSATERKYLARKEQT